MKHEVDYVFWLSLILIIGCVYLLCYMVSHEVMTSFEDQSIKDQSVASFQCQRH